MNKDYYAGTLAGEDFMFHWDEIAGTTDFVLDGKSTYFANLTDFRQIQISKSTFDKLCERGKAPSRNVVVDMKPVKLEGGIPCNVRNHGEMTMALNRRQAIAAAVGAVGAAVLPAVKQNKILRDVHSSLRVNGDVGPFFYLIGWDGERWKEVLGPFQQEDIPGSIHCTTKNHGLLVAREGRISHKGVPPHAT